MYLKLKNDFGASALGPFARVLAVCRDLEEERSFAGAAFYYNTGKLQRYWIANLYHHPGGLQDVQRCIESSWLERA